MIFPPINVMQCYSTVWTITVVPVSYSRMFPHQAHLRSPIYSPSLPKPFVPFPPTMAAYPAGESTLLFFLAMRFFIPI